MKKIVAQKKWVYTLYNTDQGLLFSVVCGGIGLFNVDIALSAEEAAHAKENSSFLDSLAEKIRNNPEPYMSR